jgi:hypothetical protein
MLEHLEEGTSRSAAAAYESAARDQLLRMMPPPPRELPFIESLMTDAPGNLWVRLYHLPADSIQEWWVYSAKGRLIGTMATTSRLRITEIGDSYILGVYRDEEDVQIIRKYALLK